MNYLVSIIIPTFNRSYLLLESIKSVISQNFQNWECIIVDDGSSDNTKEVVGNIISLDDRFKYFNLPNHYTKGACACRNYGFEKSAGKYIQWLDDDDILSDNKIELQVEELEKLNNINLFAMCSWDLYWPNKKIQLINSFKPNGLIKKENFLQRLATHQTFIPPLAYLTPRDLILKAGYWNTYLTINQDAEFFNRVLLNSEGLINLTDCYVLYRQHDGDRISQRKSEQDINSFFFSLSLMQSYLKVHDLNANTYFKWKLLKWFLAYYKSYPDLFIRYRYLFRENGINLNYRYYYVLKYNLYKMIYPFYKSIKK